MSASPSASIARTAKRWLPRERLLTTWGEAQGVNTAPSRLHSKLVAPAVGDWNRNRACLVVIRRSGFSVISVSGAESVDSHPETVSI